MLDQKGKKDINKLILTKMQEQINSYQNSQIKQDEFYKVLRI